MCWFLAPEKFSSIDGFSFNFRILDHWLRCLLRRLSAKMAPWMHYNVSNKKLAKLPKEVQLMINLKLFSERLLSQIILALSLLLAGYAIFQFPEKTNAVNRHEY
jgi:hypothetical protein